MSIRSLRRSFPLMLALSAGLALGHSPAFAQPAEPPAKKVVKSSDQLPRHTYQIQGKASEFVVSVEPFEQFMAIVRKDLESDLATHDIQDKTTLQQYLGTLQAIAMLQGRYQDAVGYIEPIRELETKEAQKLVTGIVQRAIAEAKSGPEKDAEETLKTSLDRQLRALPFDKIREIVKQRKSQMEIATPALVKGQLEAALDPVVEAGKGVVSNDVARQMVQLAFALRVVLPNRQAMAAVYGKLLDDNASEALDIWAERSVTLGASESLTPVIIGVWDSGVDTKVFPDNLWTNTAEKANGQDDDGNGFVDDIHGIAFDMDAKPTPSLLFPLNNLKTPLETVQKYAGGFSDLQSNIDSPRAKSTREYITGLKAEQVGTFMEDLSQWGNYMHGTHVAGIAADGNPAARILTARIEFDYRTIPLKPPSVEQAIADAAAAKSTVDYFKAHGVRVVNMSWGGSRQDIENALEQKGVGKTPEERANLARRIFGTMREGLDEAIKSAPDILFVAAAGNSNNDALFSEMIPSGLDAPNMITIGAVDQSGKPTGFTTFGKNVELYASGYQVDSYVPGGAKEKASGTSMAAPQVANLAGKILAVNPKLSSAQVVGIIKQSADPMPGNNPGRYLINPKKALELTRKSGG